MKKTQYLNLSTYEITESHTTAMGWYRGGANIKVFYMHNPENFMVWDH